MEKHGRTNEDHDQAEGIVVGDFRVVRKPGAVPNIQACRDKQKTGGRGFHLGLEADRSRLPRRLVIVVQLDDRRLHLVAERLRLVVSDG